MAYACLCEGITDETVGEVIAAGATSVDAVGEACGAGTGCGSCTSRIEGMVAAAAMCARDDTRVGAVVGVADGEPAVDRLRRRIA